MEAATLKRLSVPVFAAFVVAFHLYLIFSALVPNLVARPLHMAMALPWVFILGVEGNRLIRWSGVVLGVLGIGGCLYIVHQREILDEQYGSLEGTFQFVLAGALIVIVLEMARRSIKLALPMVAVIALAYGMFGEYLPGEFGHPGLPFSSLFGTLIITEGGIWGQLTGVSVNVVAVFVILGAFVGAGEGGQGFMSLATALAGRYRAGAAKVSVLSSAFFGSISGSASANVASTGAITLPTMKRLGYPSSLAAAVEAVASSGGQIMPPLMGAGAFVMVELLRVRYTDIMQAAILPATLFFVAVWVGVDMFAQRYNLKPMKAEELPDRKELLTTVPFFVVPFGILLTMLFASGVTPQYAAGIAIIAAALLLVINAEGEFSLSRWGERLSSGSVNAAKQIAAIASIILCAGLVIGVLHMTGLGVKITSAIISLSGGNLWGALVLTALACLVLGMEVPTTAAYVICVSVAGPALQELGLPALQAHLFVFWYALLSTITPPVCGTVFIAAGMARTPWIPVAGHAMRLGVGLYIVPLAFIANPALVHPESGLGWALFAFAKIAAGLWLISRGLIGGDLAIYWRFISIIVGGIVIFAGGIPS